MKSNQARVAEIFNRAEAYQAQAANNPVSEKSPRPRQVMLRWVASLLVVVLLLGTGIGLFIGLGKGNDGGNGVDNFDKMYIANFANYQAIGAGTIDATAEQVQTQSLGLASVSAQSTNKKHYLVGVDKNNNVERCRVSRQPKNGDKQKDDESYEIGYEITNIYSCTRYTFVEFAPHNISFELSFSCQDSYVIDNLTGKFYSLNVFSNNMWKFAYRSGVLSLGFNPPYMKYHCDEVESEDSVFITIAPSYANGYEDETKIYQMYVRNNNLVLEEVFDYSLNLGVRNYFVDKFNNIYLIDSNSSSYNACNVNYILTNYGEIIKPTEIGVDTNAEFFRSLNGICYVGTNEYDHSKNMYYMKYAKYVGADGQLHDNDFDGCGYFFEKAEKVKSVGNVDYYFHNKSQSYNNAYEMELFKITWEDEVKFTVEEIEFSRPVAIKGYVVTKDYIYIIEENVVSKIETTTGNVEPVNSDKYIFTAIQADYLGNVIFNGNDKNMRKIVGVITNDGEISILTQEREYQIYYIAPVN